MFSYAQNGEDVRLSRALWDVEQGFYVDIGANDPVADSVTKHFSDLGWSGLNVEPHPRWAERLRQERPRDTTLAVGVSDHEGQLTFFRAPVDGGLSTFDPSQAEILRAEGHEIVESPVEVTTLAKLLEPYADRTIDFLKIDVEMHEAQVVRGGDWRRYRPRIVVIEAVLPDVLDHDPEHCETGGRPDHRAPRSNGWEAWERPLLEAGYQLAAFDGLNRYYVREEDRHRAELLARPISVLDWVVPYRYRHEIDVLRDRVAYLEAYIEKQDEELSRREAQIGRQEPYIASQNERIGELETYVEQQNLRISELEAYIGRQDQRLAEQDAYVGQQTERLAALDAHVVRQDERIVELEAHIARRDERIAELEAHIARQDERIVELEAHIARRDERIAELEPHIARQEEWLTGQGPHFAEQAERIERQDQHIAAQDARIARQDEHIGAQDARIARQDEHIRGQDELLERQVERIATLDEYIVRQDEHIRNLEARLVERDEPLLSVEGVGVETEAMTSA
jgi:FkbM family methyltransferase